ncbi:MAG: flagellar protein FliT [Kangiellaceae bacterium]|nr:flagellar protein FliT [Kangiellaceae bacterium]MCW8999535.1 flagellar protein FliT [Kangiellaceae bacterium]MCW9018440.1 flagellar protein FliT [Kangiellaceae bacterium]
MNNLIKQISGLNKLMHESALAENWEQVVNQSKLRHQLIESFFEAETADQLEDFVSVNKEIRATDEKIKALMKKQKKSAIETSLDLRNTQSALRAYQAHQT